MEAVRTVTGKDGIYQEDGNRIHGLTGPRNLDEVKKALGIRTMERWPPSSPDFNPTENIWRILKQRLAQQGPFLRIDELKQALREEWARLTQDEIRHWIRSMPDRMKQAIERDGLATQW